MRFLCLVCLAGAEVVLEGGGGSGASWSKSVDTVMGGKSSIEWRYDDGGILEATGVLSNDGGGFAGLWRRFGAVDLAGYGGVEVAYEALSADAPPLAVELRLEDAGGSSSLDFGAAVALLPSAEVGAVGRVTVPFDAFVPRWRGSRRTGSLDLAKIDEIGFSLLFQAGAFTIRILSITAVAATAAAYEDPPPASDDPSPAAAVAAIDAAIGRGAYVYNKGYAHLCDRIYAATARGLGAALAGRAGREAAAAALADAAAEAEGLGYAAADETARAWTLRDGLDAARAAAVDAGDAWEGGGAVEAECGDASDWTKKGRPDRTCGWVAKKPSKRCKKKSDDGVKAKKACLASCDRC